MVVKFHKKGSFSGYSKKIKENNLLQSVLVYDNVTGLNANCGN
jgi:hypothetical protein